MPVKVVSITDVREEATKLVEHTRRTREPVLVCVRSRPAAYLVDVQTYEALLEEVKQLRHDLFWAGVSEAEAEHRAGQGQVYDDVEELIADLGLEQE
ncbi:MAG: type II toxin-antitoxin system Phd/YefM family antitoxin [Chloroflexi bacterium]|nr:type II toxin-antitoxin system Phd/YefM family antitoxin [Chloroflexota bacterium]